MPAHKDVDQEILVSSSITIGQWQRSLAVETYICSPTFINDATIQSGKSFMGYYQGQFHCYFC